MAEGTNPCDLAELGFVSRALAQHVDTLLRREPELADVTSLGDDRLLSSKYGAGWAALAMLRLPSQPPGSTASAVDIGEWRQRQLAKAEAVEQLVLAFLQTFKAQTMATADACQGRRKTLARSGLANLQAKTAGELQVRELVARFHSAANTTTAAAQVHDEILEKLLYVSGKTVLRVERELDVPEPERMYVSETTRASKWKHVLRRRELRAKTRAKRALEEVGKATKRTRQLLES